MLIVACAAASPSLSALGTSTHRLVNMQAAESGGSRDFDEFLRASLGFRAGTRTVLRSPDGRLTIQEWLGEGGVREDDLPRSLQHFHDPLQPWDQAGLSFLIRHTSSVRWMQQSDQTFFGVGSTWSWPEARRVYYEALTEPDPGRREQLWATLFRMLGQMMHLVVDASVPEHARNDPHPRGAFHLENAYESWVSDQHIGVHPESAFVATYLSSPIGFREDILRVPPPAGETVATAAVARLIDADRYVGSNPTVTADSQNARAPVEAGIAEIANANFFSEDTLGGQYPSPIDEGVISVDLVNPASPVRTYFSRPAGQGLLPANPLRGECGRDMSLLGGKVLELPRYPCVDEVVWAQVAAHMLPRAVGYARGVLDYFFRGSLAVTSVSWNASGLVVEVENRSTEEMDGRFEIWARHDPDTPGERRVRFASLNAGDAVRLGPGERRIFDRISAPPDAVPTAKHLLVFKGRLGLEAEAIAGQTFTVPVVEIRQATYEAETVVACGPQGSNTTPPYPETTFALRVQTQSCGWRVVGHRATGILATNMPIDSASGYPEPIIDRVEARWSGASGPAPLTLDGRRVPGVWQRQGSEADPAAFEIIDPSDHGSSVDLYLLVTYRGGTTAAMRMVRFASAGASHGKTLTMDNRHPGAPRYLVSSVRSATGMLWYDWAGLFDVVSHNGSGPANSFISRPFGNSGVVEGRLVNDFLYLEVVIDDFEEFASEAAANAFFTSIALRSPHPAGPAYLWNAEVRRVYAPAEREFMRAFMTANPGGFSILLTGYSAD